MIDFHNEIWRQLKWLAIVTWLCVLFFGQSCWALGAGHRWLFLAFALGTAVAVALGVILLARVCRLTDGAHRASGCTCQDDYPVLP